MWWGYVEEGTPRTKAISVHKGDMEWLDYLKGGIDFSRYFPQIANEFVSSQGHLQLEWERTTDLMYWRVRLWPECLLPPQSQDLPWVNPWTMNTWKYLRRTEWTIVMQHNAWLLGIPWSDTNIALKSHPDLVWKWPQCLVAAILEKLAELPGSSGNYGACG